MAAAGLDRDISHRSVAVRVAPTPCAVRGRASLPPPEAGDPQATGDPGGRTEEEHT
ncbi:MAG: hypothetical protein ACRDOV_16710 [Streptomyces sp.]